MIISKLFTLFLALAFLVSPFNSRICGLGVQTNQDTASYQMLTDDDIKDIKKSRDKFVKFLESRLKEPNDVQILMQILENTKEPNEKENNQATTTNGVWSWMRWVLVGILGVGVVAASAYAIGQHCLNDDDD